MKNLVKFILFILYTIVIFLIKDEKLIVCIILLNFIVTVILKIKLKNIGYHLKFILPFVLITAFFNIFLASLYDGILMGIRMIICYHITYLFSKTLTMLELADTIETLCFPLKIFKIDTKHIGIMICISICMIPILKNEMNTLIKSMKAKGKCLKMNNIYIIMKPTLISALRKTSQIEKTLIAKAFKE